MNKGKNNDKVNKKYYQDSGIKIIIEIPEPNEERDKSIIKNITKILNDELILQISN